MIPAPLAQALRDPRLNAGDLRAYAVLLEHLDLRGFREVKLSWLASAARLKGPKRAYEALRQLLKMGYLLKGPKYCEPGGQCYATYRLLSPGEAPTAVPVPPIRIPPTT